MGQTRDIFNSWRKKRGTMIWMESIINMEDGRCQGYISSEVVPLTQLSCKSSDLTEDLELYLFR